MADHTIVTWKEGKHLELKRKLRSSMNKWYDASQILD